MFETGDYVVYGHSGICEVMGTTTMSMDGVSKERLYYVLRPDGSSEGKIFTPVDNKKQVIRKVMTREEAEQLIDEIPNIEVLQIDNEKFREEKYKECIRSCESKEMVRIIKTIHLRGRERISRGKKTTLTDERYLKLAEENLYSELSMLLNVPKSKMENYIADRIEKN
jgi:CarD family transcriptional regulator